MNEYILSISIGILALIIVRSHMLLSNQITKQHMRQNQRLTGSKKRDIKLNRQLQHLERQVVLYGR